MISETLPNRRFGAHGGPAQSVIDEMSQHGPLTPEELRRLYQLGAHPVRHEPYGSITSGEGRINPFFLLSGWAMRARSLNNGRRQIIAFLLPGDFIGELSKGCAIISTGHTTTAPATEFLRDVARRVPFTSGIVKAMKAAADLERDWLLERIVRLGKLDARARLGHLFLELRYRLDRVGLAPRDEFRLPVTQDTLSETVGISMVHANRSLQQMRRDKLIDLKGGRLRLLDRRRLEQLCDFTPPGEGHD